MFIDLVTANCIVTGEPATLYTGYVVATDVHGHKLTIGAGFRDLPVRNRLGIVTCGCFGDWKESMGVKHLSEEPDDSFSIGGSCDQANADAAINQR